MSAVLFAKLVSPMWDWRWITTAVVFALTYFVGRFYHRVSKYPKGPFPLPLVGNLLTLRRVQDLHVKSTEWTRKYGDVFTLWMSHKPMVVINGYTAIREAFLDRRHEFAGRFPTKMGELQTQGNHDILFEDYNPRWKALRKVALLAVRKYAVSESLEKLCTNVVDDFVGTLKEGPQVIDSWKPFYTILHNLIGTSVYGTRIGEGSDDIRRLEELNRQFIEISPDGLPSDIAPWLGILYHTREQKIKAVFTESSAVLQRLFIQAEEAYEPGKTANFTHAMLAAREQATAEEKGDAEYLTKGNMIQVVVNIFGAATDTSAGELQWLFLRMARDPSIQAKIQQEIEENIGSRPPVYADREKMPFTVACLLETLRYYPIVPLGLPHNTTTDTKVGGWDIPKNTGILYNIHGVNHDPKVWDKPQEFRPQRFLDTTTGKLRKEAGPLMTFGLGPRTCPGEKLGHVDMFYVLVRLMQRVSCSAPGRAQDVNLTALSSSLFCRPTQQNIVLTKRN